MKSETNSADAPYNNNCTLTRSINLFCFQSKPCENDDEGPGSLPTRSGECHIRCWCSPCIHNSFSAISHSPSSSPSLLLSILQAASRLVFVSVKDAKPKRKVAVPIPENGSWDVFLGQIKGKLKLAGVGEIFLASTGERVVRLDQLQDIDELYVVEVKQ